jgi:hypothetical protein
VLFEGLRNVLVGWFAAVLVVVSCGSANGQTKNVLSVDLRTIGLPSDAFEQKGYKDCPYQYFGYRSVEWLDARRLLVAFNTSQSCSLRSGLLDGSLRLAIFNTQGDLQHTTDVGYDAGDGMGVRIVLHGGIWIGPKKTVLVDVPSSRVTNSRDKVLVFSDELIQIQEIDTHEGILLEGVSQDRQQIFFSSPNGQMPGGARKCLAYSSVPTTTVEECSPEGPASIPLYPVFNVPKGFESRAFPGCSMDGLRSSVFLVRDENAFCLLFGKSCPSKGKLVVFETKTGHVLVKRDLPLNGRAALSPDGQWLAVLEENKLKIFTVP